jgi:hypothetical protein
LVGTSIDIEGLSDEELKDFEAVDADADTARK